MISEFSLGIGIAVLAVGTYLIRLAGPLLRNRLTVSATAEKLMDRAPVVLLVAVALTGAVFAGHDFAGWARPAGVAVGVLTAVLRRADRGRGSILAAATAAGLRALGLP